MHIFKANWYMIKNVFYYHPEARNLQFVSVGEHANNTECDFTSRRGLNSYDKFWNPIGNDKMQMSKGTITSEYLLNRPCN